MEILCTRARFLCIRSDLPSWAGDLPVAKPESTTRAAIATFDSWTLIRLVPHGEGCVAELALSSISVPRDAELRSEPAFEDLARTIIRTTRFVLEDVERLDDKPAAFAVDHGVDLLESGVVVREPVSSQRNSVGLHRDD
jgi:hypothetical protein